MAAVRAEPYEFEFDPRSCALVIIDMQRDFVDPGGFGEALGYALLAAVCFITGSQEKQPSG